MNEANGNLVQQIFEEARFVRSLGIELTSFGYGWCETRVRIVPSLEQQHGLVHAGVLMMLADHTCGGAVATTAPDGQGRYYCREQGDVPAASICTSSSLSRSSLAGGQEACLCGGGSHD